MNDPRKIGTRNVILNRFRTSANQRIAPEFNLYHRVMKSANARFVGGTGLTCTDEIAIYLSFRLRIIQRVRVSASQSSLAQRAVR